MLTILASYTVRRQIEMVSGHHCLIVKKYKGLFVITCKNANIHKLVIIGNRLVVHTQRFSNDSQ